MELELTIWNWVELESTKWNWLHCLTHTIDRWMQVWAHTNTHTHTYSYIERVFRSHAITLLVTNIPDDTQLCWQWLGIKDHTTSIWNYLNDIIIKSYPVCVSACVRVLVCVGARVRHIVRPWHRLFVELYLIMGLYVIDLDLFHTLILLCLDTIWTTDLIPVTTELGIGQKATITWSRHLNGEWLWHALAVEADMN